jgi:hypothetical protein
MRFSRKNAPNVPAVSPISLGHQCSLLDPSELPAPRNRETSGSRRTGAEAVSVLALWASSETAAENPRIHSWNCSTMYSYACPYLYSN